LGADPAGLTITDGVNSYSQNAGGDMSIDACAFGSIYFDTDNQKTWLQSREMSTGELRINVGIPWYKRVPAGDTGATRLGAVAATLTKPDTGNSMSWKAALARGGRYFGEVININDVGNQPLVSAIWDGTRWQPESGRQTIYNLGAELSTTATSPTATLPTVTIPGGLMGVTGGWEAKVAAATIGAVTASTTNLLFSGNSISSASGGASRKQTYSRHVRNRNSASAQWIDERASENGNLGSADAIQTLTVNTAIDQSITGSVAFTTAGSDTATVYGYQVVWIGG
jgi:hypothetical protein